MLDDINQKTRYHTVLDQGWHSTAGRDPGFVRWTGKSVRSCKCNSHHHLRFLTVVMQVDRQKVLSKGKDVAGELLISLQVYKSTADGPGARKFYTELTTPLPGWDGQIRDLVLKKKLVSMIGKWEIRFWLLYSHERFSSSQERLLSMMRSNSKNTLWRLLGSLKVSSIANCKQGRSLSKVVGGKKKLYLYFRSAISCIHY